MKEYANKISTVGLRMLAGIFMLMVLSGSLNTVSAADKAESQSIIDKSKGTINELMSAEAYSWLHGYIKDAKAVIIFPQVLKAGFFLGGSGGTGVMMVHNSAGGTWGEPSFYTVGSVTFGLQFGGEAAEVVMLAMTQKAVDSLLTSTVKLGGDASVAIGPIGGGAKGSVTVPAVTADFVSFTRQKVSMSGSTWKDRYWR